MMIGNERSSQTSKPPPPASPAALPLSASRRRFSRVGRKHSNGSVQSSSSSGTARSTESVGIRQPAKNKIRRHQHRLSAVFGRGPRGGSGEMAATGEEALVTDDPSELSNHITAPGILKIFGTEICEGANYKSILATTRSSARELVKEALARYSLSKEDADDYVLCDVIGCIGNQCWRTECVRVVGDNEKPLLLQSLWKPREGFARRFEIQRKATVEENNSKDQDTVTAGINAQARKLQKTRCRGKSVPLDVCVSDDAVDSRHNLFKSLSDTDLTAEAQSTCTERTQEEDPEAEADKATQCPANELFTRRTLKPDFPRSPDASRSESDAADWPSGADRLIRGLEPLVLWMSNAVQILHFIHQQEVPLLHGVSQEEEEEEEEDCIAVLELRLSSVRSASEEAMTVLEEVLMFTFQQCVYYLTKMLYPLLPGVLDSHAFSDSGQLQVSSQVRRVLDVCSQSLRLLRAFDVHPDISAQLFSYLFFFINALLFNLLMERGSGGAFYCWSRGVQVRANLDLLMDWAHGAGLADLAHTYLLKLSSAVNLLATPKENLLQMSWKALRMEFPSLNAAQLHHILREYEPRRSCPAAWTPSGDEDDALATADILESFDQHPPLILPADGFILQLRRAISETQLITQLHRFQRFSTDPEAAPHSPQPPQLVSAVPMEAKLTKMELHPKAHLEVGHTEMVIPPAGASDLGSCEALLTKKLQNLELQDKDAARPALDPSCLLTPPNTPQNLELTDSDTDSQQHTSTVRPEEGESEESEIREEDVFVLELQRAACGLGLMLADGEESPSTVSGIYIKSVLPDSPAALSQRLRAGDRILAVNGLSLAGVDYQTGRDLIQMSGERPRLLVARSHSATKETRTKPSA
ncbi:ras-associating and dilute domain-containing protein [Sinocyclocheilus rhinocerous]|uniref:ras-associating and dilute domain-containing protein n=1 Tax=Sinocyclocheilus rhinocerous TaxID=307959 RepID=UPI0007B8CDA7|nr:PREDICTED: ras-associating and dilute domain-containing protein-like [Sinocyclocheilus rhinocerous]